LSHKGIKYTEIQRTYKKFFVQLLLLELLWFHTSKTKIILPCNATCIICRQTNSILHFNQSGTAMHPVKCLSKVVLLLVVLQCSVLCAFSQNISWIKGLWNEYSGMPYKIPPVKCINALQITTVADSTFTGLQTTYFTTDTTIQITYACSGLLTKNKKQFYRGKVLYKKNSNQHGYKWNECAGCDARLCSLYVEQDKIILLIKTDSCDSACNGTITYYRNLNDFDSITQRRLISLYSKPQYSSLLTAYTLTKTNKDGVAATAQHDTLTVNKSVTDNALPPVLRERKNKLAQTLQITAPYIEVILLDDAEIDGDIVSLYHNNEEVINHKTLGKEVIKYSFKADKQHTYHELVLVAENLGSIPPNTALMRIRAGDKKYELTTRANLQENAKVIIEYTGE